METDLLPVSLFCRWQGCAGCFSSEMELYNHIIKVHGTSNDSTTCKYIYSEHKNPCGYVIKYKSRFASHIITHFDISFKPLSCQFCRGKFRNSQQLSRHLQKCRSTTSSKNFTPSSGDVDLILDDDIINMENFDDNSFEDILDDFLDDPFISSESDPMFLPPKPNNNNAANVMENFDFIPLLPKNISAGFGEPSSSSDLSPKYPIINGDEYDTIITDSQMELVPVKLNTDFSRIVMDHVNDMVSPSSYDEEYLDDEQTAVASSKISGNTVAEISVDSVTTLLSQLKVSGVNRNVYTRGTAAPWMVFASAISRHLGESSDANATSMSNELITYQDYGGYIPMDVTEVAIGRIFKDMKVPFKSFMKRVDALVKILVARRRDHYETGLYTTIDQVKGVIRECVARQSRWISDGNIGMYIPPSSQTNTFRKLCCALALFIKQTFEEMKNDDMYGIVELSRDANGYFSRLDCSRAMVGFRARFLGSMAPLRIAHVKAAAVFFNNLMAIAVPKEVWGSENESFKTLCCNGTVCGGDYDEESDEDSQQPTASGSVRFSRNENVCIFWIKIGTDAEWVNSRPPRIDEPVVQCVF